MESKEILLIKQNIESDIKEQAKYNLGAWLVKHGIRLETQTLNKEGWPGFTIKYYDKDFYKYIQRPNKKRKKRDNDGPDFTNFFPDWQ